MVRTLNIGNWSLDIERWELDIGHCLIQPPTIISPGIGHWGESVWLGNAGFSPSPYSLLCPAMHCNPAPPPHNEMAEQHFNALRHSFSPVQSTLFATEVILPRFLLVMDVGSESIRVVENCSTKLGTKLFFQKLAAAIL